MLVRSRSGPDGRCCLGELTPTPARARSPQRSFMKPPARILADQAIAMISTGLQESGLRHHAVSPMGCGKATFSKTRATPAGATPTWRSTNSSTVSTDTGTRLARHLEIDLLAAAATQRPVGRHRVRPGRQGYLTEIPSQLPRARALYREITCTEGASNSSSAPALPSAWRMPRLSARYEKGKHRAITIRCS